MLFGESVVGFVCVGYAAGCFGCLADWLVCLKCLEFWL